MADTPKKDAKPEPKREPCQACNGTGEMAWGDGAVPCGVCDGKGTVKA